VSRIGQQTPLCGDDLLSRELWETVSSRAIFRNIDQIGSRQTLAQHNASDAPLLFFRVTDIAP
jgi:hypothetical protein